VLDPWRVRRIKRILMGNLYQLRPYQETAVRRGIDYLRANHQRNGIEVLPTGSGKSLVIASIVTQLGEPCLIFQPSKEILEQNFAKFVSYGCRPAVYSASIGEKRIGDITLATIGSVKNKYSLFDHMRYAIVDECHFVNAKKGMYSEFFEKLGGVKILGLTATPYRLVTDSYGGSILKFLTRTRPRVLTDVVYQVQTGDLFRQGFLAKLQYHQIKGFNRSKLQVNSTGADYTDKSVQAHFQELNFSDKIVKVVERLFEIGRRSILVFTRFVEESRYLQSKLQNSAIVTADTPKAERELLLDGFKSGKIKVICNVGVLTTGFDYPELETVVLARPTMSLALYYQMVGRAVRPHPEKSHAMIVDMVDLVPQFGHVEDLILRNTGNDKWVVSSNGRQLTNIYYGDRRFS